MVDHHDSYTHNLVHLIAAVTGVLPTLVQHDAWTPAQLMTHDAIVLSPGPGTPDTAGICLAVIERFSPQTPLLGVCLGHQAIGQAMGGEVVRAPHLMHGKTSRINHTGKGLFRGLNSGFEATRYHSLIVKPETLPASLEVTASTDDGLIMGMQHRQFPSHGVQFHPESIASENGHALLQNFLTLSRDFGLRRAA